MSSRDHPGDSADPANDNGTADSAPADPRILRIAAAIGRQIAREQIRLCRSVNDNDRSTPE
ncbi:hypothetical protein [Sphingomonas abietis]|uniref:Uncharacterized protein n=1 Tax=Sphingomonas abietis TaxID=3012344 RepID=A0ABY7NS10_9SPHN|nr:hypothetical protein [Sphingomonas abietis]WBO24339.1 hypothetical protein PBT88_09675 [Sphingomonas abietis]